MKQQGDIKASEAWQRLLQARMGTMPIRQKTE